MRPRRLVGLLPVLAACLVAAGCGNASSALEEATPTEDIAQLAPELLPGELLGLTVAREDMSGPLKQAERSYTDAVGLYSFRSGELLQATLQVTRFNADARVDDPDFRHSVVSQIGGSVPREVRLGADAVFLTRGTKQSLSAWFRGRHLMVLAVREDYLRPRALLRETLKIQP